MKTKRKKYLFNAVKIHKFQKKDKIFAFFLFLFILIFLYIKFIAMPLVINNTDSQLRAFATKSINYAVADTMKNNINYDDLITVVKDSEDNVAYIESNSIRINLLSKTMSKVVMTTFLEQANKPIKIPLGSFSGIALFSGVGPKVAFEVNPYGEVLCSFKSNFESAGINQTYHKLYLIVSIKINVVFPFQKLEMDSSSEVLLCETLIIGNIPEVYLKSSNLTEMLNLVPSKFTS